MQYLLKANAPEMAPPFILFNFSIRKHRFKSALFLQKKLFTCVAEKMALSKYRSMRETTNLARIARIILGPCTDILRCVLNNEIQPFDLSRKVSAIIANTRVKHRRPLLNKDQERLVYGEDYSNFDILLLYLLLRNICSIQPHRNGWGNVPLPGDRSLSANIERIRIIRNEYCVYISNFSLSDIEFERKWTNIFQIVQDLEMYLGTSNIYQDVLMLLKTCYMDPDVEESLVSKLQDIPKQNDLFEFKGKNLFPKTLIQSKFSYI